MSCLTANGHLVEASVTNRIQSIHQPYGGYLPIKRFNITEYVFSDELSLDNTAIIKPSIQGCAVDYLVRFLSGFSLEQSFAISLIGASRMNETNKAKALLKQIKGLDDESVLAAIKLVHYDVVVRLSPFWYADPADIEYGFADIHNVRLLVQKTLSILSHYKPITEVGFTFEGGYNDIIATGDGDYLTEDTMWDLKCSEKKPTSADTCQLAVYLILGYHSFKNEKYKKLKYIGFINPILGIAYRLPITDVSETTLRIINNKVVGYLDIPINDWNSENDIDNAIYYPEQVFVKDVVRYMFHEDGIFRISWNEYLAFLRFITTIEESDIKKIGNLQRLKGYQEKETTQFQQFIYEQFMEKAYTDWGFSDVDRNNNIDHVLVLKNNGLYMFLGESPNGTLFILDGKRKRTAVHSSQYYFDNMKQYADNTRRIFQKFWDAQDELGRFIASLKPSKDFLIKDTKKKMAALKAMFDFYHIEIRPNDLPDFAKYFQQEFGEPGFSGYQHGCIVDMDFFNHVYVNPIDGTTTAYYALSMADKWAFKNIQSLIAAKRPEMLEDFMKRKSEFDEKRNLIVKQAGAEVIPVDDSISIRPVFIKDTNIYGISTRFETIRHLKTENVIRVWYDGILSNNTNQKFLELINNANEVIETNSEDKNTEFHKRRKPQSSAWTVEEVEILKNNYLYIDINEMCELLPSRSKDAIRRKALTLGMHKL